ncbi:MAG TPA: hypothetical protein VGJ81_18830 [Thermoanaerobaculia bacterium]|jgi:hypothetical protein
MTLRRQKLAFITAQAVAIGTQLIRNPDNAVLVPHIQEVKRLRSFSRRKKTAQDPQSPTPSTAPATTLATTTNAPALRTIHR